MSGQEAHNSQYVLCGSGVTKTWLVTLGRKEAVRRQECEGPLSSEKSDGLRSSC